MKTRLELEDPPPGWLTPMAVGGKLFSLMELSRGQGLVPQCLPNMELVSPRLTQERLKEAAMLFYG